MRSCGWWSLRPASTAAVISRADRTGNVMSTVTTFGQKALAVCFTMEYAVDRIMTLARFWSGRERMMALMPSLAFSTNTTSRGGQRM